MKGRIQIPILVLIIGIVMLAGCKQGKEKSDDATLAPGVHKVKIEEVLQASNYTYLRAKEGSKEIWMAVTKQDVKEGETYYYAQELEMKNFPSKDLKRTFESILFVQTFSPQPIAMVKGRPVVSPGSQNVAPEKAKVTIDPVVGGITIQNLFDKKDSFAGKKVKVRGEVVKYNSEIMGKNWAHLQDGTSSGTNFDLTVTTKETLKKGDIVTMEGIIALKKDFGAGYFYDVIMEDAVVVK